MIQAHPSSSAVAVPMRYQNDRGMLGRITTAIGDADKLCGDYVIPSVFDRRVAKAVSKAVAKTAKETGVARRQPKLS